MSPYTIKVLLHHYCIHEPWPNNSSAYQDALEWMYRNDLSDQPSPPLVLTPRGVALVRMLCATPLPAPRFINPMTGEVVEDAA